MKRYLVLILIGCTFFIKAQDVIYTSPFPKFTPYHSETVNDSNATAVTDYKQLGLEQPARWLSVDPLADKYPGWSPYNYCANNPTNNIDPDGRFFIIDDFIVGVASGLISGKSVSESVSQGATYASNCADLWSSFGRGDFGQVLSKLTWEAPQQLIGVLTADARNMAGDVSSVTHQDGATLVQTSSPYMGGAYTLGGVITTNKGCSFNSELVQHEYGHYMQSQIVGPTYLLSIALPSLGSAIIAPSDHNEGFYTEIWANQLAKKKFGHLPWH